MWIYSALSIGLFIVVYPFACNSFPVVVVPPSISGEVPISSASIKWPRDPLPRHSLAEGPLSLNTAAQNAEACAHAASPMEPLPSQALKWCHKHISSPPPPPPSAPLPGPSVPLAWYPTHTYPIGTYPYTAVPFWPYGHLPLSQSYYPNTQ